MQRLRVTIGGAATAVALAATGCAPPPEPPVSIPVEWTATGTGSGTVDDQSLAIDSNDSWYVEHRFGSAVTGDPLRIYPRTGSNGDGLGTPQTFTGGASGFLGTSTLVTKQDPFPAGTPDLKFFHEVGGTWSEAGTFDLPEETHVIEYSDDTMVTATNTGATTVVSTYDVTVVGGTVIPTLDGTFTSPATWGSNYEQFFAGPHGSALDGDVLALSSRDANGFGPGRVAIYRNVAGSWTHEHTITGNVPLFGRSLAIDDQGDKERLAIGVTKAPDVGEVDLYRATQGNWVFDATVTAPTLPPSDDTEGGTEFGSEVGLDGNLLVVGSRTRVLVPTPAGDERVLYHPSVFHWNGSAWQYEEDFDIVPATFDPAEGNRAVLSIEVHGSHVVTTLLVLPAPGGAPTPLWLRSQAWRWDRNLLP